jgi:ADP-heptose:LPS heptosyltransferase
MKFGKRLEIALKNSASVIVRSLAEQPPRPSNPPYQRILFIRYGGIGDMILSLPIFRAARVKFPDARIDVLCDPKNADPLQDTGLADNVALYDKNPEHITRMVRRLRRQKYDYIVNLVVYPSFTFGMLARLIGPDAIRAAGDQERFSFFYNRLIDLPPKRKIHMLDRLFLLSADITGMQVSAIDTPWAAYGHPTRQEAERLFSFIVNKLSLNPGMPRIAAINLSAGLMRREWPLENYKEFLRIAVEKYREQINAWAIVTNPQKPQEAQQLADRVNHPAVVVLPVSSDFRVMMELLRHIYLLITPDTSFVHAASAMGTPVLDLMIGENVAAWAPVGVPNEIVSSEDPLSFREVPVSAVLEGFEKLLGKLN